MNLAYYRTTYSAVSLKWGAEADNESDNESGIMDLIYRALFVLEKLNAFCPHPLVVSSEGVTFMTLDSCIMHDTSYMIHHA